MIHLWNRLIAAGIRIDTPQRKAGYIRSSNITSVVVALWLLSLVGGTAWIFFDLAPVLVIANLLAVGVLFLAPLFNRWGWYKTANVITAATCLIIVTFNALHLGRDSWNHVFLLVAVVIAFQYMESLALLIATTVAACACFLLVEGWYLVGNPVLISGAVPPLVFQVAQFASIYNLFFLTVAMGFANRGVLDRTHKALDAERLRSETLLLNILPQSIAERLKVTSGSIADQIPQASILFADIVGFTPIARSMDARHLVSMLNEIFIGFDRAAKRLGLEKIKTIGDAYMVAAGIPEPRADHADACVRMARAMLEHMNAIRQTYPALQIRVGIHTGPVVAGVIGESKFNYDLWGDSVNIASRMESHGEPGRIHLSEACRQALDPQTVVEDRGLVDVKGQGPMRTYLIR